MKKGKIVLAAMLVLSAVGSAFAYNAYRVAGNLYIYTTTPASPVVPIYAKIPCHTLNQQLGNCTYQVQKYSYNTALETFVSYNPVGFAAASE